MIRRAMVLLFLGLLAACQEQNLPDLPAEDLVNKAAASMEALRGFHFVIERTGAPAYIDSRQTLSFRRAEGEYAAPDRARAVVRLILPGLVTDVSVVSVGAVQWETNPLSGQWVELPPDWGFNPAVLFREDVGLPAILATDLTNKVVATPERLENGPDMLLYKVTGLVAGERLYDMSGSLIGPEPVEVTMWIEPETFFMHRIVAVEPVVGSAEPSVWQVDFSQFGELFEIAPPILE